MDAEQGAGEDVLLAAVPDVAEVEHPVPAVKPAVGPPGEGVGQLVGVGAAEAGDDDLGLAGLAVGADGVEEDVGGVGHPDAAVAGGDAGGDVQPVGEDGDALHGAVAVGVLEDLDAIAADAGGAARILQAFDDPDAALLVEGHGDGVDQVRLAGDDLDGEAGGDGHLADRFLRRQGRAGRSVLTPRQRLGRLTRRRGEGQREQRPDAKGAERGHGEHTTHDSSLGRRQAGRRELE